MEFQSKKFQKRDYACHAKHRIYKDVHTRSQNIKPRIKNTDEKSKTNQIGLPFFALMLVGYFKEVVGDEGERDAVASKEQLRSEGERVGHTAEWNEEQGNQNIYNTTKSCKVA
jgi:hypothetical protein